MGLANVSSLGVDRSVYLDISDSLQKLEANTCPAQPEENLRLGGAKGFGR